jgi:hypothetical protein
VLEAREECAGQDPLAWEFFVETFDNTRPGSRLQIAQLSINRTAGLTAPTGTSSISIGAPATTRPLLRIEGDEVARRSPMGTT